MRTSILSASSLAVGLFAVTTLWSSQVLALSLLFPKDTVVCYTGQLTNPPDIDAWTFNVKEHSPLDLKQQHSLFNKSGNQITYTALGKIYQTSALVDPQYGSLDGMVMVGKDKGARMAFTRYQLVDNGFGQLLQQFECESVDDEDSSTPEAWDCDFFGTGGPGTYILNRVDLKTADQDIVDACEGFPGD